MISLCQTLVSLFLRPKSSKFSVPKRFFSPKGFWKNFTKEPVEEQTSKDQSHHIMETPITGSVYIDGKMKCGEQ